MCEPASLATASLIIGGTATVGGGVQQYINQGRMVRAQERTIRAVEQNAAQSAASDYQALGAQLSQQRQSVALEAWQTARQAEVARGALAVGAQASGIRGGTVTDMSSSIASQLAIDSAVRRRNLGWTEAQIARQFDAVRNEHISRLNAAAPQAVPGVDWLGLVGGLAQLGTGYANFQGQQQTNQRMAGAGLRIPGQR